MNSKNPIYLDYNATTPIMPEVVNAMIPYLREHFGNPSSGHVYGQRAKEAVELSRLRVASLIGAQPDEIIFTSGGTEANNLAIFGTMHANKLKGGVVTSVVEHPATSAPCQRLTSQGVSVGKLRVDPSGRVNLQEAEQLIGRGTALVTVIHANNETGAIQPIRELAKLASEAGAVLHTDAAQSVGKMPVKVDELGVDLLSIAGHKLYAPKGVGALYIRRGLNIPPTTLGAGHERGVRPGTENVASIFGLGVACAIAERELFHRYHSMLKLRDMLWQQLKEAIPGLELNGHEEHRLPNTLNVRFPKVSGDTLLSNTPEIAASTGSACDTGQTQASAVVRAMGVDDAAALGSVRLSVGKFTTEEEISLAGDALIRSWKSLAGG